ncbi:hypothetical protein EIP91_008853 [Steccherinum ochraceum]|uniref:Uncharacterized protein n=1 Tax=Steccherinum ochraceum TaxID=92696 RepID=A0A4R0RV45_9APHY|nr:hypothetical protein EIP91_008853 [Steccherinum ochraceum]
MVSSYAAVLTLLLSLFVPALAHWEDERPHHHVHHYYHHHHPHHHHPHYFHPGHFHIPWRAQHAHPISEYNVHEPSLPEHDAPQYPFRLSAHEDAPVNSRVNDVGEKVAGPVTDEPPTPSSDFAGGISPPVPGYGVPVGAHTTKRSINDWFQKAGQEMEHLITGDPLPTPAPAGGATGEAAPLPAAPPGAIPVGAYYRRDGVWDLTLQAREHAELIRRDLQTLLRDLQGVLDPISKLLKRGKSPIL